MITLNYDGKKIRDAVKEYLIEIDKYKEVEQTLIIQDVATNHQLYIKYLDKSEELFDKDDIANSIKIHALANKFFINYTNGLKTLGVSAIQRKKLALVEPEKEEENSIFKQIENALSEEVVVDVIEESNK